MALTWPLFSPDAEREVRCTGYIGISLVVWWGNFWKHWFVKTLAFKMLIQRKSFRLDPLANLIHGFFLGDYNWHLVFLHCIFFCRFRTLAHGANKFWERILICPVFCPKIKGVAFWEYRCDSHAASETSNGKHSRPIWETVSEYIFQTSWKAFENGVTDRAQKLLVFLVRSFPDQAPPHNVADVLEHIFNGNPGAPTCL